MREFFPLIFGAVAISVFGGIEILLMAVLNRPWWSRRWIRRAAWILPLSGIISVVLWGLGMFYVAGWLAYPAAMLAILTLVLEIALMVSLPLSGVMHLLQWSIDKCIRIHSRRRELPVDSNRRAVLRTAAAGLPLVAVSMGVAGVTRAFSDVRVFELPLTFEGLSPELEGLRILQLTDTHLAHLVGLEDLAAVLRKVEGLKPDLVVMTGDIADDLDLLSDALGMTGDLHPRYGVYACLGNHEHYRGLGRVRREFDRSPVPLLVNESVDVKIGGASLLVGGVDDPRRMHGDNGPFFRDAIGQVMAQTAMPDFSLLMSHRPDALKYASGFGVSLVLAGHTHGGQIGFGGRSLFEPLAPQSHLWGEYREKDTRLYTSSGVGHWFPFRLGCPPEAPVIVLRSV